MREREPRRAAWVAAVAVAVVVAAAVVVVKERRRGVVAVAAGAVLAAAAGLVARRRQRRAVRSAVVKASGAAANQFPAAQREFRSLYDEDRERGSRLAVVRGGALVLDLRGARDELVFADESKRDLAIVFSSTKAVESLVVAMLEDRGLVRYDDPLERHFPGAGFSPLATVRDLMTYRAGCAAPGSKIHVDVAVDALGDADKIHAFVKEHVLMHKDDFDATGQAAPVYHPSTRGWLVAAMVVSLTGMTIEAFVQREVVAKLTTSTSTSTSTSRPHVELHVGCPPDKQHRVAEFEDTAGPVAMGVELVAHVTGAVDAFVRPASHAAPHEHEDFANEWFAQGDVDLILGLLNPLSKTHRAMNLFSGTPLGGLSTLANFPTYRAVQMSSSTGITTAPSLATVLGELALGGGRLVSREALMRALRHRGGRTIDIINMHVAVSDAGWGCWGPGLTPLVSEEQEPTWVGWFGAGGSMAVFSPVYGVSVSYVPTKLDARITPLRARRLLKAVEVDLGFVVVRS